MASWRREKNPSRGLSSCWKPTLVHLTLSLPPIIGIMSTHRGLRGSFRSPKINGSCCYTVIISGWYQMSLARAISARSFTENGRRLYCEDTGPRRAIASS